MFNSGFWIRSDLLVLMVHILVGKPHVSECGVDTAELLNSHTHPDFMSNMT